MAHIINELTGRVRGKVGNLVYRITTGNTSLCALPTNRKIDNSPPAVVRKNRFKLAVKLAAAVNKLFPLKYFWKLFSEETVDIKKSAFNKIMKKNYPFVTTDGLSDNCYIVPFYGFEADLDTATITDTTLTAELLAIGTGTDIDTNVEKQIQLEVIFFVTSPVIPEHPPFRFVYLESPKVSLNLVNPLSFTVQLNDVAKGVIADYTVKKAFMALVTFDVDDNPVRYSNTFIYE